MSNTFKIGRPGAGGGGGSGFQKAAHVEHLVAFVDPQPETRTGQAGDSYEVALCSFVVCTTCSDAWADVPVSGVALVPRLVGTEDEIVCGHLVTGEAKPGRSAPYLLEEPTDDELEEVQALFAKHAARLPSGRVVFDVDSFTNPSF